MQLNHDYFTTPNCKVSKSKVPTNARYSNNNFHQLYYTVGDVEQFWVARNLSDRSQIVANLGAEERSKDANLFSSNVFIPFEGFHNISQTQMEDTFNYMFHKFKKGIYVRISNGELDCFIPFSKVFYTNEWYKLVKIDPAYSLPTTKPSREESSKESLVNFFKTQHILANQLNNTHYRFDIAKYNLDPRFWYANNCILRYENPLNENDTNYAPLKSMFLELCASRKIPDVEFFVNKRDFPLLTRNHTEPYNNIYGDNTPLKSFNFEKYAPVLSMSTSDKFADIAIPTHEDWSRVKSDESIFFPPKCRNYKHRFNHTWETKKPIAVFRGSNTGCGYNTSTNTRLKLAKLGTKHPSILDVGITNWNLRIRKNKDSKYLRIPDVGTLKLVPKLNPEQQSNYKYIIHVDGHVSAFRLSLELGMGSCLLLVESAEKWTMWFSHLLKPYVHFVPINTDLSNLMEQIAWCLQNDAKCKEIAANALDFHNKYLGKRGVLDYLEHTLVTLHNYARCPALVKDPLLFQSDVEHTALNADEPESYKTSGLFPQNQGRNYGTLNGFMNYLTNIVNPENRLTLTGIEIETIFTSKTTRVVLYQIGAMHLVVKKTIDKMKKIEMIHEAFIGKKVINNLLKICPNFLFTFLYRDEQDISYTWRDYPNQVSRQSQPTQLGRRGTELESSVLQEYVNGPTFQDFLKKCSFKAYLEVVLSLTCALQIGQRYCNFVHNDLKPWNIMINVLPEPVVVEYPSGIGHKIKTRYIPIMIDYGKSHVTFQNISYGINYDDPFKPSFQTDLITMLLLSLYELIIRNHKHDDQFMNDLIHTVNFLNNNVQNVQGALYFLSKAKKYDIVSSTQIGTKISLEAFLKHMSPIIKKYKVEFNSFPHASDESSNNFPKYWVSNSRQILDMGLSLTTNEKIDSYLNVVRRIYKNPLPIASNKFSTFLIAQKLYDGIVVPKMEFLEFAVQSELDQKRVDRVLREFAKMETFIVNFYQTQLHRKQRMPYIIQPESQELYNKVMNFDVKPSRRLFLSSDEIKKQVMTQIDQFPTFPDYMSYRLLCTEVLKHVGLFALSKEDRAFYMDNFRLIFDDAYISKVNDIETIKFFFLNT